MTKERERVRKREKDGMFDNVDEIDTRVEIHKTS